MRSLRLQGLLVGGLFTVSCALVGDLNRYRISEGSGGTGTGNPQGGAGAQPQVCVDSELDVSCNNGVDDDCDGIIDCNDDECQNQTCEDIGATCGVVPHPCGATLICSGAQNGSETDEDCGGDPQACPDKCAVGQGCLTNEDCLSLECDGATCQPPLCGDGMLTGAEECDLNEGIGNAESWDDDGCTASCLLNATHLLITEVVEEDDAAEFIEIFNPTDAVYDLTNIYLSNWSGYYDPGDWANHDWIIRFPAGESIASYSFLVVSLESATKFNEAYGGMPDYDLKGEVTQMLEADGVTLAAEANKLDDNSGVVLFEYTPLADLVVDHDYLVWGDGGKALDGALYKGELMVGNSTYAPETPIPQQLPHLAKLGKQKSLYRCDPAERTEIHDDMSNGIDGDDETSENFGFAFVETSSPTPGMAPANVGPCP
jgi:hypothetical protein